MVYDVENQHIKMPNLHYLEPEEAYSIQTVTNLCRAIIPIFVLGKRFLLIEVL